MLSLREGWLRWATIWRLLPYAGRSLGSAAVVLNIALGVLPLAFVLAFGVLLQRLGEPGGARSWESLAPVFGVAVGTLLLHQVLAPVPAALGETIARRVDEHCVQRLMSAALHDSSVRSLESQDTLDLLSDARAAFSRAAVTPGDAVAGALALVARYTQLAGAVLLLAVFLHPLAGALAGLAALVIRFGQRGSLGAFAVLVASLAGERRGALYLRQLVTGSTMAKEIRVLRLLSWAGDRLHRDTRNYLDLLWAGRRRLLFRPFVGLSVVAFAAGAGVLVALGARSGHLTLFELLVSLQVVLVLIRFGVYFPESDVPTAYGMQSYTSMREFERVARTTAPPPGAPSPEPRHSIRFERVSFRYDDHSPDILRDLDLEIEVGRSTAVVGLNGAGKTTLIKLLARFYEPTAGRITVDGDDLSRFDVRDWQRRLAVIFQDYNRYEFTAGDNIAMGAPERGADRAALREAVERAAATEVVEQLPGGLDTVLSRRYRDGRDLSGGQWQRIALARAFFAVRNGASIMVLDEPTAQLDVRTEVEFFDRVIATATGLTSVIISHRFSTVRHADRIVVIEDGRVVEQGGHDDLMRLGGRYAEMFALQADRFRTGTDAEAAA